MPRSIEGRTGQDVVANFPLSAAGAEVVALAVPSLWWTWSAPASGAFRFSTHASEMGTRLVVHAENGSGPVLASNDDEGDVRTSAASFLAVAGRTYAIHVETEEPTAGLVTLTWAPRVAETEGLVMRGGNATSRSARMPLSASAVTTAITPAATYEDIPITGNTGEKPQSKLWTHDGTWWAVLASTAVSPGGAWVWRHDQAANTWTNVLQLSPATDVRADVKSVGPVAHVLLHGPSSSLVSIEYVPGANTYALWSLRPTPTALSLPGSETATLDIDSTGKMWIAYDSGSRAEVLHGDAPYASFSEPVVVASGIAEDDICVVTALPGAIGLMWSNQNTERFGFRTHADGADPSQWTADEVPGAEAALDLGNGMADDHINLAVSSDGTLYAAVKTSYDTSAQPVIGLLVRRPGGAWDDFYGVDNIGTRPIVLVNESENILRVVYTASVNLDNILEKTTAMDAMSFSGGATTIMSGLFNNATSTKQSWVGTVPVMASSVSTARTVFLTPPGPPPPVRSEPIGSWLMDEGSGSVVGDGSGLNNQGSVVGSASWVAGQSGSALSLDGSSGYVSVPDSASLDVSGPVSVVAWFRPQVVRTQYVVKKASSVADGYELGLSSAGRVFFRVNQASSGNTYRVDSTSAYPANGSTWVHAAGVYDGSRVRLYLDGVEQASVVGPVSVGVNALALAIGAEPGGAGKFQGAVDSVEVYARALSATEIASMAEPPAAAPVAVDGEVSTTVGQAVSGQLAVTGASRRRADRAPTARTGRVRRHLSDVV
jgi:hypothetical protein